MKKILLYILSTFSALLVLATGYLWLTFASPFGYNPSGNLPKIEEDTRYSVFVYGTLTKPWVRWLVMGRAGDGEPAKLSGFRKQELDIEAVAGAVTNGEVITVDADELRDLDRYERLGVRYERVQMTLKDGQSAWVYQLLASSPPDHQPGQLP